MPGKVAYKLFFSGNTAEKYFSRISRKLDQKYTISGRYPSGRHRFNKPKNNNTDVLTGDYGKIVMGYTPNNRPWMAFFQIKGDTG